MANNLVVQLLLKTGTFSNDLKQARGQIQNFQQGCQTAGKSVSAFGSALGINVGALTKLGGAVGAAVVAGKALKGVIDANQKSADAFEGVIYSVKTAVNEFAYAIGTFDFSNFQNGLSDLIRRAKEAHGAIDQLGNTLMSYNIKQAKAQAAIAKARAGQKNKNLSQEEKQALVDAANVALAEAREATKMAIDDFQTAIIAEVNARGAKLSGEGAMEIIDEFLTLDGTKVRDEIKTSMGVIQKEYDAELGELQKKYMTDSIISSTIYGVPIYGKKVDTNNPDYVRELSELNQQYQRLHTYNVLLVKEKDEELKKLGEQRSTMYNLEASMYNMEGSLDMVQNKIDGTTKTTDKGTDIIKESLEYWKDIEQKALKTRDNSVYMTKAWQKANSELAEASEKISLINEQTELYNRRQAEMNKGLLPAIEKNPALQGKAEIMDKEGLNGTIETKRSVTELQNMIRVLEELRNELKEGDPYIANYNQQIDGLRKRIEGIQNAGIKAPEVSKEVTSSWDSFNQAMANTSTIVSSLSQTFKEGSELTASSILSMVSTVLPAIGTLIASIQALTVTEAVEAGVGAVGKAVSTSKHWIEAIAAVATLGAVVAAAISAAKSQGKYAQGGIVGGNSFTGDRVVANVNSGEMILNKTQQANLFRLANGGLQSNKEVEFHISGTELVGVLNNVNRKNRVIR